VKKSSRWSSLTVALLGIMLLLGYLTQPRVQALHRADIVGFTACGACIAGLFGRLVIRNG
jgi:hypothetical protein